jgi:hypothetical protein
VLVEKEAADSHNNYGNQFNSIYSIQVVVLFQIRPSREDNKEPV